MTDRRRLYGAVFLRALAIGLVGVLLGFHLRRRGWDEAEIGFLVAGGLWGMALLTLLVATHADRVGRRRSLVALCVLAGLGILGACWAPSLPVALGAAFLGMLNGAGRDRGALPALEQSVLAATTTDRDRTRAFALYNVADDAGLAAGALLVWVGRRLLGASAPPAALQEGGLLLAAGLSLPCAVLYARLSRDVEPRPGAASGAGLRLSPASRGRVAKLSALFALDGVGGGFLAAVFLALFFRERFGASEEVVALLFFGSRVLNALSHLGAAWLARRIGLLNTMVFTHAPSSLLLLTVAIAPSFPVAAVLFLLREGLVEMDVPTRQSYVMAIVRPEERTAVSAITNLVRILAWAVAAWAAGRLMRDVSLVVPLVASAALKLTYDGLLYAAFRRTKPPEETAGARAAPPRRPPVPSRPPGAARRRLESRDSEPSMRLTSRPLRRFAVTGALALAVAAGLRPRPADAEDAPAPPPGEAPAPPEGGPAPEGGEAGPEEEIPQSMDARIGQAVERGVKWLKGAQLANGSWGDIIGSKTYDPKGDPNAAYRHPAGSTGLAIYALLKCGVPVDDPVVRKGFKFLKEKHKVPGSAYELSAVILAVTATADPFKATKDSVAAGERVKLSGEYRDWAKRLVDALVAKRQKYKTLGWRYHIADNVPPGGNEDLSSTQFAALALLAADRCGIPVDSKVWNEILTFTLRQQEKQGPEHPRAVWPKRTSVGKPGKDRYAPPPGTEVPKDRARGFAYILSDQLTPDEGQPTGGMTACGVCTLQMARYVLAMREDKVYLGRDLRGLQQAIFDGLAWLDLNWSSFRNPKKQVENVYHVYYLYCCERAFDLLGNMRIGDHTWFPEMAEELLAKQAANGSWDSQSTHKPQDVLDTCFALLFLRRATKGGIPFASLTDPGDGPPTDHRGG